MAAKAHIRIMPEDIRKMCELKEKHGLSIQTIAQRFGISASSVRTSIKSLRSDLTREHKDE